jgi:hypothetical protein
MNYSRFETAHPIAHPSFDRIEPIVEKILSCFANRLRGIRLRDNVLHGVVSYLTLQRQMIRGLNPGDYATLNSNQLRDGDHGRAASFLNSSGNVSEYRLGDAKGGATVPENTLCCRTTAPDRRQHAARRMTSKLHGLEIIPC